MDPETKEILVSKTHLKNIFCNLNKKNRYIDKEDEMTIPVEGNSCYLELRKRLKLVDHDLTE